MNRKIGPIRTQQDYLNALEAIEPLFATDPAPGTEDGDFMEVMLVLIATWEDKHYKIVPPSAIEAIRFRMQQQGLTVAEMAELMQVRTSRLYEILNGSRGLSKANIMALHEKAFIPLESLMSESQTIRDKGQKTHVQQHYAHG